MQLVLYDMIYSRKGLSVNDGISTSGVLHDHVLQRFIMVFVVLVTLRMCNIMRFEETVAFDLYRKIFLIDCKVENYTFLKPYKR